VMFSSDAIHNVHEHFPFRSHLYPPSYELSANTVMKKAFSLLRILQFTTRKSNGSTCSAVLGQPQPSRLAGKPLCSSDVYGGADTGAGVILRVLAPRTVSMIASVVCTERTLALTP
jgi:hypothetical protein